MNIAPIEKAIKNLWLRNTFDHGGRQIVLACLIRESDWRPLKAPWWRGKEVYVMGADLNGNFILRHCDGSVRYWTHQTQSDEMLAASVREFVAGLREHDEWKV